MHVDLFNVYDLVVMTLTAQHLPLTRKSPSDTSTSQSWHTTLTSPAKTLQLSTYPEGWIYETNVWKKLGSPPDQPTVGQGVKYPYWFIY